MQNNITARLNAIAIARPQKFSVNGKPFYLYPETLGKTLLISAYLEELKLLQQNVAYLPQVEAVMLCVKQPMTICTIIAITCAKNKAQATEPAFIDKTAKFFRKHLSTEEMAELFMIIINADRAEMFFEEVGITEDQHQKERLSKKNSNNSATFGGHTIFGQLIDAACQRYGWSYDYVVWGVPLAVLKLMLADAITSMYVSDDERKKLDTLKRKNDVIDASKLSLNELSEMTKD